MFHTCYFFCGENEVFRKDWLKPDPITETSFKLYQDRFKIGFPQWNKINLDATNESSYFHGRIKSANRNSAIYLLEMRGIVGLKCLYLSGKVPSAKMERSPCLKFHRYIASLTNVTLPMTPFEIDKRPLFYYILFNLDGGDLWKSSAHETLLWAHGIGLAMLHQHSKTIRS